LKEKITGLYGKECAKFIQVHADEDPDHIDKALEVINKLDVKRLDQITINIEQTALCYSNMLSAAQARSKGTSKKVA
ncbi:hypothetical protein NY344_23960, partial [Escherichia coli]|uniref:hypothetical protein n=1 Tax=Escherichia coli TaxID=562 RepID=UPI0022F02474